jgi:ATP-dependent DNA helicase RecG
VPVYPSLGPLGPAAVRRLQARLLASLDPGTAVDDPLPAELRRRHGLPSLGAALAALHAPPPDADVGALNARQTPAHRRLVYGELFELQRRIALLRDAARREEKPHRYRIDAASRDALRTLLPFRLTGAQRRVLGEIVTDLRETTAMQRLVQGDVGCGKTIVAALAMALAAQSGLQAAFMAPTELLAEQHFATLGRLLGERYRVALVTASAAAAASARAAIARGEVDVAVGTHALIQEGVSFARLGLAVIDEQHRFGVHQRRRLATKGERPDVLVMTATPIPRSLALTAYGDLDLSVIDELPPGRTPVRTETMDVARRDEAYELVRRELERGGQAYVVFPLIEESESVDAGALETAGAEAASRLAPFRCAVLHGRTPVDERERIMSRFAGGEVSVLLATTVIEVGVDVPRANVMVIESAERFGLSQLHQLRGRIGRGGGRSRCIALHGALSDEAARRLEVFATQADGFAIAEADLEIRGPGDLLGTRQAGTAPLRVASLLRDAEWLAQARRDARAWVREQPPKELERWRRALGTPADESPGMGG